MFFRRHWPAPGGLNTPLSGAQAARPLHTAHAPYQPEPGVQLPFTSRAGPQPPPHAHSPRGVRRGVFASSRHATTRTPVKMAAAVLSGPSAGSAAGAAGGTGGLSAVASGPRLRLLLLESVSGLLQPRAGSTVAPVHPHVRSAAHLPGLMCLLRLHGTVGGAQVSLWPACLRLCWKVGAAPVRRVTVGRWREGELGAETASRCRAG